MYGNIAVSLTSIVGFPLKEKDTLTVRVEAKEISEIREALELNSHMFRQHMSMLKRYKIVTSNRRNLILSSFQQL